MLTMLELTLVLLGTFVISVHLKWQELMSALQIITAQEMSQWLSTLAPKVIILMNLACRAKMNVFFARLDITAAF
jgi:hypothetical protein